MSTLAAPLPARARLADWADAFAIGAAAALPWSTSVTGVCLGLWFVTLAPTLSVSSLRTVLATPAGALPVLLAVFAVLGMLWADVAWTDRIAGLESFLKLLAIPLLFVQFARSNRGSLVIVAFVAAATVLLAVSWFLVLVPGLPWVGNNYGVPVKDSVSQSGVFTVCVLLLAERAACDLRARPARSLMLIALALVFLLNMLFICVSRTALVVLPILLVILGIRYLGRRVWMLVLAIVVAAAVAWQASPYLRLRVNQVTGDIALHQATGVDTSSSARIDFWTRSKRIILEAPFVGHGTGTIRSTFARDAGTDPTAPGAASNPHNQTFAVGIQLGAAGCLLLVAMWIAHWRLFLVPGFAGWFGMVIATQNIVSSLFNSHLFDYAQGWLYVLGVGIAGGMVWRDRGMPALAGVSAIER